MTGRIYLPKYKRDIALIGVCDYSDVDIVDLPANAIAGKSIY